MATSAKPAASNRCPNVSGPMGMYVARRWMTCSASRLAFIGKTERYGVGSERIFLTLLYNIMVETAGVIIWLGSLGLARFRLTRCRDSPPTRQRVSNVPASILCRGYAFPELEASGARCGSSSKDVSPWT